MARLGGDEFAVILPDISRSRIETIAQNIIQILNEPFILDQNQVEQYISTSIGIVLYPQDGADIESLMKHADQAMYKAKWKDVAVFVISHAPCNMKPLKR